MKKTEQSIQRCVTISTVQKILGGKWKIEILYYIGKQDIRRFGELRRHIGGNHRVFFNKTTSGIGVRRFYTPP